MTGMKPSSSRSRISSGFDRVHLADEADVDHRAVRGPVQPLVRADQGAVLAGQAHRPAAVQVDQPDDLLVDLADQDHLDDLHRLLVGHPHPAHEARLLAEALHERPDLRAAAVDDHGPDPDEAQQEHVLGELLLQVGLLHGRPAVLDDEGLALERADVRQRLDEDLGAADDLLHAAWPATGCTARGLGPRGPRRAERARSPRR